MLFNSASVSTENNVGVARYVSVTRDWLRQKSNRHPTEKGSQEGSVKVNNGVVTKWPFKSEY